MTPRTKNTADSSLTWFKSSYSGAEGGDCVEVAASPQAIQVRDSKDPARPGLAVGPDAWAVFVGYAVEQTG
ncbi:DUF397 domain-containing protein [Streptomyces europaeiscabiei]|uniref:DUF397 domain-containing protein n=1 Tax=Streptomyces europaeiscabiei TaxID=146819 RepID=UPI0029B6EDC9|nr:DUF397 domain-containing protein [Streptomyces europaeiscabiei]MDX2770868.1 DUF397 domain-containing protein [Streptomyces europaeiscabiei]